MTPFSNRSLSPFARALALGIAVPFGLAACSKAPDAPPPAPPVASKPAVTAIKAQAARLNLRCFQRDAGAGFHRIDIDLRKLHG